jgi:hypothetical protein
MANIAFHLAFVLSLGVPPDTSVLKGTSEKVKLPTKL